MKRCLFAAARRIGALSISLLLLALCAAQGRSLPEPRPASSMQTASLTRTGSRLVKRTAQSGLTDKVDRDSRIESARRLERMGEHVDWRKYDLLTLLDMESRVESARHLQKLGVAVDWRKLDSSALSDMEMRVETAQQLARQGIQADWRKYDLPTLMDMQTVAETLLRLQERGVTLDWRKDGMAVSLTKPSSAKTALQTARSSHRSSSGTRDEGAKTCPR
jgi:hypothetical protein